MSKKMSNFAPDFERGRRAVSRIKKTPRQVKNRSCPGGGMVDAVDSKSAVSNGVRVQVPPGVQGKKTRLLRKIAGKTVTKT